MSSVQVGHFLYFDEDLLAAVNAIDALLVAPRELALVLDAAGGLALEHVDRIAAARLAGFAADVKLASRL